MKIIDWKTKGNIVRFYLGKDDLKEWYGDDWNDCPYECNAGTVYEEFISGICDMVFDFDSEVYEPCFGHLNSNYAKEDFMVNEVPVIVVATKDQISEYEKNNFIFTFENVLSIKGALKFRMGDKMEPTRVVK